MMDVEKARKLAEWLQNESEDRMKKAISRKRCASVMENATEQELRESKVLAEKMSGRKLDLVSTSKKSATKDSLIQGRIASKLEVEAIQLASWADDVLACAAEVADCEARVQATDEQNQRLRKFIIELCPEKNGLSQAMKWIRECLADCEAVRLSAEKTAEHLQRSVTRLGKILNSPGGHTLDELIEMVEANLRVARLEEAEWWENECGHEYDGETEPCAMCRRLAELKGAK